MVYQPAPQYLLERPQTLFTEQHAPQVGEHTKPDTLPHVPSVVSTPVVHGGATWTVVLWAAASAGSSNKTTDIPLIESSEFEILIKWWSKLIQKPHVRCSKMYWKIVSQIQSIRIADLHIHGDFSETTYKLAQRFPTYLIRQCDVMKSHSRNCKT